jgi:NADPH:quinone reductase
LAGAPRAAEKRAAIRSAGAETVVDYGEPGWAGRVVEASGGTGPDVVFDGVGGSLGQTAFGIVADGGRFSAHGTPGGGFAPISANEAADRAGSGRAHGARHTLSHRQDPAAGQSLGLLLTIAVLTCRSR